VVDSGASHDVFAADAETLRRALPTIFQVAGYMPPQIEDATRTAIATRNFQHQGHFSGTAQIQAVLRWSPEGRNATSIHWTVNDVSHGQRQRRVQDEHTLGEAIAQVLGSLIQPPPPPGPQETKLHNLVLAPGAVLGAVHTGTLRDYSACAQLGEVQDLGFGVLPLGRYAFEAAGVEPVTGPELFVNRTSGGAKLEYNGVLVCAPQNSGKTMLVRRWAEAATASNQGYATFVVDVKGNLRQKLEGKLKGEVFCFSTDPKGESDRINFLDGPMGLDAVETERVVQLATSLLPSRGFAGQGGIDEYHYRNRVIWLTAFIHLLKLAQCYYPEWFLDPDGEERNVDLVDLYELIADEAALYDWIFALADAEAGLEENGVPLPPCGADHWASELAIMLDPQKINCGQRPERDTYRQYTTALLSALEPFSPHGTLHQRVRSFGPGRQFDIEGTLGGEARPVTVLLVAREQDLDKSTTVLSLVVKRLQWFLFERMQAPEEAEKRPVLLLLDEARRIRDFDAAEYVTFAREAKAACVIVYQAIDQILPAEKRVELLENIGTQIYLGSLVGNTARSLIGILPQRQRLEFSQQVVRTANTETLTTTRANRSTDFFTTTDLYSLPAGRYPALVYINDSPHRPPFFTDMTERARTGAGAKVVARPQRAAVAPPPQGEEIVLGPPTRSR
jgi:hypothetical protein